MTVKVAVETTSLPVSWQVARSWVIVAVTSIALANRCCLGGLNKSDVAGAGGNPGDRAGAADGIDAAAILIGEIAGMAAGAEQGQGQQWRRGEASLGAILTSGEAGARS